MYYQPASVPCDQGFDSQDLLGSHSGDAALFKLFPAPASTLVVSPDLSNSPYSVRYSFAPQIVRHSSEFIKGAFRGHNTNNSITH